VASCVKPAPRSLIVLKRSYPTLGSSVDLNEKTAR
jgi:hypothetical protein